MALPVVWEDYGPEEEFPDPPPEDQVPFDESSFAGFILDTGERILGFRGSLALGYPVIQDPGGLVHITSVY